MWKQVLLGALSETCENDVCSAVEYARTLAA
jgi:hypothetical protein